MQVTHNGEVSNQRTTPGNKRYGKNVTLLTNHIDLNPREFHS